jgi:hypothetical protein
MKTRATILASAALIATGAAAATAAAPRIAVDPSTVHRGQLVRVHGTLHGCAVGDTVTLLSRAFSRRHSFAGVPAVFATVRAGGRYSVRTRIPARRRAGLYHVTGRCGGGNLGVAVALRVIP